MSRWQIRRGLTRTVLLTPRWAIKFPSLRTHDDGLKGALWSFCRGVTANQSEAEWSGYHEGLCPVLLSLAGLVNVYPRCEPVTDDLTDLDYEAIGFSGPTDRKTANVGVLNGRRVWVDYDMNWNDQPPCRHVGC
jgi:hypothetical protein